VPDRRELDAVNILAEQFLLKCKLVLKIHTHFVALEFLRLFSLNLEGNAKN